MAGPDVGVAILAGGQSRRMGTPKSEIVIPGDGRTLLDRVCDEMSFFERRYLSLRKDQPCSRNDYQRIDDRYEDIGPMGAICTVLEQSGADALLVLACDMPGYTKEHALKMLEQYDGEDIMIPKTDGGYEPLAAIYNRRMLPGIRESIDKHCYKLSALTEVSDRIRILPEEDPEPFGNINYREQLS